MHCPGCTTQMEEQRFAGNYGKTVTVDLCHACDGLWFDGYESLQLTPGSILALFASVHQKHSEQRRPLAEIMQCPRCRTRLTPTTDRQRDTRFYYTRCPRDHGRFIPFFQFLREKNFVRSLDPKEINELKQKIKMIHCSNCEAAVDLEKDSACKYCRSPIAMLDPQQIEKTVQALQQAEEQRQTVDPTFPVQMMIDRLKVESLFHRLKSGNVISMDAAYGWGSLVGAGLSALSEIGDWSA